MISNGVPGGMRTIPARVRAAKERASSAGFALSCEDAVGELLATLAAAVPPGGRIVELGTGCGVGLAWLVEGLGARTDVEVVSVDVDESLIAATRSADWPAFVRFVADDGASAIAELAPAHLVFADAYGGKIDGLDATIAALAPGGVLMVDDMDPALHVDDGLGDAIAAVRTQLMSSPVLRSVELAHGSGVILAVRGRDEGDLDG